MAGARTRVLFVSHTYVVGVNQRKLKALHDTDRVEVGLVAPAHWTADAWRKRYELERPFPQIRLYPIDAWFEGRRGAYLFPPSALRRAAEDFRPDLIQYEGEAFALEAFQCARLARRLGRPLAVFCWENVDLPLSWIRRRARAYVLSTARLIVAGNHEAGQLARHWGYDGPVEVMPQLGVDPALFPPRSPDRSGPLVIGFVGRLAREKGVDVLLDAARRLADEGVDFRVEICGTGPDEAELRGLAVERRLDGIVTWRGHLLHEQVPEAMKRFDVLVLPSRSTPGWKEQFGHVLIEAMSMAIPVAGSACGEIPRVIARDDLVFPEGDAGALARILRRMADDEAWRRDAAQHGLARVRAHYTDARIAERLLEAWKGVLAS